VGYAAAMLAGDAIPLAPAGLSLLAWYDARRRDLPWRHRSDPWAIWVSEVMLQQTQVETACRYYEAFLERFPTLESLAGASEEEVLAAWSGLGYYRRARNLRRGAVIIAQAGEWPTSADEWKALPGIGEYTAAAISSIAGGEAVPVLDGNVERVISRLIASREDPKKAANRRRLAVSASQLLDESRPGDSNQALMELGALICRPRSPNCGECPLRSVCLGAQSGDPESFPPPRRRRAVKLVSRRLFVVQQGGSILLFKRSTTAPRLAGFWELPWVEGSSGEDPAAAMARRYGGRWTIGENLGRVDHSITHRRFEIEIQAASWNSDVREASSAGWYDASEIDQLATSSLVGKVISRLPEG